MHFMSSDIDVNQMQQAKGWSDIIYPQGLHMGHLSVWRAAKGLENIVTTSGKTRWEGDELILRATGSSATVSPYGGDAIVQVTTETHRRYCEKPLVAPKDCTAWRPWKVENTQQYTVRDGTAYTVTFNDKRDWQKCEKKWTGRGYVTACNYYERRMRVSLLQFRPSETQTGNGGGQTEPGTSPGPPAPPGGAVPPPAPPSPFVGIPSALPLILAIGGLTIAGIVSYGLFFGKKTAKPSIKGGE